MQGIESRMSGTSTVLQSRTELNVCPEGVDSPRNDRWIWTSAFHGAGGSLGGSADPCVDLPVHGPSERGRPFEPPSGAPGPALRRIVTP